MKILGIDPGTSLIGWGIIESDRKSTRAIDFGAITTTPKIPNRERIATIYESVSKILTKNSPDIVALETLFFFKNAKTVMAVAEVRGVLMLAAIHRGIEVREFTPLQVKQAISGYGRADKAQVQTMVKLVLGLRVTPKPDDVADALALAICCANTVRY